MQTAQCHSAFGKQNTAAMLVVHEACEVSPFGQQFKDNGYQLGNDRDAHIFQQAALLARCFEPPRSGIWNSTYVLGRRGEWPCGGL